MHEIKARRLEAGLSQAALGQLVGCDQTTIARIEKGRPTSPALLKAIYAALPEIGAAHATAVREQPAEYKVEPESMFAAAASALHEKIRLQGEIIESQRETIEALRQTVETLKLKGMIEKTR